MLYRIIRRLLLPFFSRRITRVEGMELVPKDGGFLLAANHIDYLDGFFLSAVIGRERPRLVTFLTETRNYWWTGGATIPIDPLDKPASLDRALRALDRGTVICIFPEGRRNPSQTLLTGKTGLARLAAWSGKPVIPVGITGPSGASFLGSVAALVRAPSVSIRFGQAIVFPKTDANALTKEALVTMTTRIMEALGRVAGKSYAPPK